MTEIFSYTFEARSLLISLISALERTEILSIGKAFSYYWLTKCSLFILRFLRNLLLIHSVIYKRPAACTQFWGKGIYFSHVQVAALQGLLNGEQILLLKNIKV